MNFKNEINRAIMSSFLGSCFGMGCINNQNALRKRIKWGNHFNRERNQSLKNKESYIEKGSYGFTFKNYTDPKKVIKVYFNPSLEGVKKKYNTAKKVENISNYPQDIEIVNDFRYQNLPINVPEYVKNELKKHGSTLPAMRMPYLGIDLFEIIKDSEDKTELDKIEKVKIEKVRNMIRTVNINTLLRECYKLMIQIDNMRRKGYCHADIRLDNVLIDPDTGVMTLIDFDLFETFEVTYKKYYEQIVNVFKYPVPASWNVISAYMPPEILCMYAIQYRRDAPYFYEKYLHQPLTAAHLYYMGTINKETRDEERKEKIEEKFSESFIRNMALLETVNPNNQDKTIVEIMNRFDYYWFGMTMTIFFNRLYPINKNKKEKGAFYHARKLLMSMCDFSIENRPYPDTVLPQMHDIINTLNVKGGRQTRKKTVRR